VLGQEKIKLENVYSKIARRRNGIRDPNWRISIIFIDELNIPKKEEHLT